MLIRRRQSSFSQFSKDLWLVVEEGNTRLDVEIDQKNLSPFALSLLDTVDDVLRKLQDNNRSDDYSKAFGLLSDLCEAVTNPQKEAE